MPGDPVKKLSEWGDRPLLYLRNLSVAAMLASVGFPIVKLSLADNSYMERHHQLRLQMDHFEPKLVECVPLHTREYVTQYCANMSAQYHILKHEYLNIEYHPDYIYSKKVADDSPWYMFGILFGGAAFGYLTFSCVKEMRRRDKEELLAEEDEILDERLAYAATGQEKQLEAKPTAEKSPKKMNAEEVNDIGGYPV